MRTKFKNSKSNGYSEINGFVNNNVRTYENLYIRKIKIRNILETKYSRFTVYIYIYIYIYIYNII